jgi:DNA-binding NtrC family response regulator
VGVLTQWGDESLAEPSLAAHAGNELTQLGEMAARSLVMQRLFTRLRQASPHLRIVALEGESGTGKTLAARTLHSLGPASDHAFVACAATRFVSAETQSLLDEARGGALFLTRLNDLDAGQQSRFFDFLEWWEHRSGRDTSSFLPRQLFVSSHQSLRQLSAGGGMRADLCYRLTAIRFVLPPLRERREDIALLADRFAMRHGAMHGKAIRGLGPGSLPRLMAHSWPGNVRELEAVIANAVMECAGQWIRPIDIPPLLAAVQAHGKPASPASDSSAEDDPNLDRMILRHIMHVLAVTGGNKLKAARLLGISRSTLYRLLESDSQMQQQ